MKIVGDLLTACTGVEGVVVGFLFLASRALQTRLEKKVNACEQAKVTLGQGQNCQSK